MGRLAATLIASVLDDRMLHDPDCDLLWSTLQDLDVQLTGVHWVVQFQS